LSSPKEALAGSQARGRLEVLAQLLQAVALAVVKSAQSGISGGGDGGLEDASAGAAGAHSN